MFHILVVLMAVVSLIISAYAWRCLWRTYKNTTGLRSRTIFHILMSSLSYVLVSLIIVANGILGVPLESSQWLPIPLAIIIFVIVAVHSAGNYPKLIHQSKISSEVAQKIEGGKT